MPERQWSCVGCGKILAITDGQGTIATICPRCKGMVQWTPRGARKPLTIDTPTGIIETR